LIKVTELDLAEEICFGITIFSLRSVNVDTGGMERCQQMVRAMLNALGVAPRLIERALKVELPQLDQPSKLW
jgi:hypothetical protein